MGDYESTMDHDSAKSPGGKLIGDEMSKNPEKAKAVSPVTYVSKDDPPHLIVHGDKDPLVPVQQSEKLDHLFDQLGVPSVLIKVKGGGHGQGFNPVILGAKMKAFLAGVFEGKSSGLVDGEVPAVSR